MDTLRQPNPSADVSPGHQSHRRESRKKNFDSLPKCFREIAAFRQDVNTKRVLTGDTRLALWESLDELVDITTALADTSLKATHNNTPEDVTALQDRFNRFLTEFRVSKDSFEKLDADLCAFDHRLAGEEMRIYEHLETASIPLPQVYNRSFPLRSIPDEPTARDDLTSGEPSEDGSDPYESKYGVATSVGNYPGLIADMTQKSSPADPLTADQDATDPDTTIVDPLPDRGISALMEQNGFFPDPVIIEHPTVDGSESSILHDTAADPHPLILDNRSPDRLKRYLLEFNSTTNRINQWLLHILRTSPLEIDRLRNAYDDPGSTTMDEKAWTEHVLELWPQENYPAASEIDPSLTSVPVTQSIGSLKQNCGSQTSEKPNDEPAAQVQPRKSWSFVSRTDAVPSSMVNLEPAATAIMSNAGSSQTVTRRSTSALNVSKSHPFSVIMRVMNRVPFRGIKGTLKKKRQRSKMRRKTGSKTCMNADDTLHESAIADSTAQGSKVVATVIPQPACKSSSSLTVSTVEKTDSTSQRTPINLSNDIETQRETSLPKPTDSRSSRVYRGEDSTVELAREPLLETTHTKLLSVGQVFLVSVDSLIVPDLKVPRFHFSIFKSIYPATVSLIVIQMDSQVGLLTACPVLKDGYQKINISQNKYRDLVVCSDISEYNTEAEIHVHLTDQAYTFPFQEQLRLNSTVEFTIPFGVPTFGIGHTDAYDLHQISHGPESLAEYVSPFPNQLHSILGPDGFDKAYLYDKGYASSLAELEAFWSNFSMDSLTSDDSNPPHYSTFI